MNTEPGLPFPSALLDGYAEEEKLLTRATAPEAEVAMEFTDRRGCCRFYL